MLRNGVGLCIAFAMVTAGCGSGSLLPANDAGGEARDAAAASDDAGADTIGTPDLGPAADAGCFNIYRLPGCGPSTPPKMCVTSVFACIQFACSCEGKVTIGCAGDFGEPYAFSYGAIPSESNPAELSGKPCDPAGCGATVCPWSPPDASAGGD